MRGIPQNLLFVTIVVLATLASPISAQADAGDRWCRIPGYTAPFGVFNNDKIDVWIHPDAAAQIWHLDNTPWTDAELERNTLAVMQTINDAGISGLPPLVFAGWESPSTFWAQEPPPGIAIRPQEYTDPSSRCTFHVKIGTSHNPFYGDGHRIHVADSTASICSPSNRTNHRMLNAATRASGEGTLMHEFMHALGLHHKDTCGGNLTNCSRNPGEKQVCGAMDHFETEEMTELEYNDWEGLEALYGTSSTVLGLLRKESTNATTWTTQTAPSLSSPTVASDWSQGSTLMPIGSLNSDHDPQFHRWNRTYNSLTSWGVPYSLGRQLSWISTAVSYGYRYLGFMTGQYDDVAQREMRWSWHTSSSNNGVVSSAVRLGRPGHSISWDPRSSKLVHVIRTANLRPRILTSSGTSDVTGAAYTNFPGVEPNLAEYPPSVACGPSSVYYNCILAWAETGEASHAHKLAWRQFRVLGSGTSTTIDVAPTYTNGYVMFGSPKVIWSDAIGGFVVAFKNPGECFYTLKKGQYSYNTFKNERQHCKTGFATVSPVLGESSPATIQAWAPFN